MVLTCLGLVLPTWVWGGDPELDAALRDRDTTAIIHRISSLAKDDPEEAALQVPSAFARVEFAGDAEYHVEDRYRIFTTAIGSLSRLPSPRAHQILVTQVKRSKDWPARLVALYAGLQCERIDGVDLALTGVGDDAPPVAMAAARALGFSQEVTAIPGLIDAMARWEKAGTREKASRRGRKGLEAEAAGRVWLACRDALERLTGESLHSAEAYRTYYSARRETIDPKTVDLTQRREKQTGLGLFGLELTGKNIVFILDISGSMMSTDPLTPEQIEKLRRSTGVGEGNSELEKALMEDRRRIVRAKKELKKVIEALSEDRNFNVIAYSTDVSPWKPLLVSADRKTRQAGLGFVEGLEAEGITVTDTALRAALEDPKIDTIYLITDGAPTHVGSRGPDLPPDAPQLMEQILRETKAVNHLRGVRIFTLGFEGAEEGFLEKLSEENHGRYVRIE